MQRKRRGIKMATQLAETPTLYGKDAEAVLKQIESKPNKQQMEFLKRNLESKFSGILTRRG
jgi:hypothetical protein